MKAYERFEALSQERTLPHETTHRIRSIQNDEAHPGFRARLHGQRHGPYEGVNANTDVLQIEDQCVQPFEHFGRGLTDFGVQRMNGQAGDRIRVVLGLDHVVLFLASCPVLGAEQSIDLKARRDQGVDSQSEVRGDGGGVHDETRSGARKVRRLSREHPLKAGIHTKMTHAANLLARSPNAILGPPKHPENSTMKTPMVRILSTVLLLVGVTSARAEDVAAQTQGPFPIDPLEVPRPTLRALKIDAPVTIDGRLDEDAWARADTTTGLWVQVTPQPGMAATEPSSVRILYDDGTLYVGARMYDRTPDNLYVPGLEPDFDTPSSDMFGIALDSYYDQQNGFVFGVNPAGALFDAQTFNDGRDVLTAWEGIADVRTTVHELGWDVEMAIPFATLRFNPVQGDQLWGINFFRRIRKNNEDVMWAPVPLQYRVYKFSMEGTLEGLTDLPQTRNLWVKPYVLGSRIERDALSDGLTGRDIGIDVKWGITPRMTMDLTANTDFSQVEVDAEQVNLTRFSLFFPEKRDFFLENEGTFAFQDVSQRNFRTGSSFRNFRLFHSRRIGLSAQREVVPILGGARLTGRVGERLEVGLINMQTRSMTDPDGGVAQPAENFSVARLRAHLPGGSSVGAMFVNRQETGITGADAEYNRAFGVDGSFNVFQNLLLSGYVAATDERVAPGETTNAAMVQAAWRSAILNTSALYKRVGDGFNPGVGFVDRRGVNRYYATVGVHPKVQRGPLLEVNPYVEIDAFTNLAGSLESRSVTPGLALQFFNGGSLNFEYADRYERLFTGTSIAGVPVPAGTYEWREPTVRYVAPASETLSGMISVARSDFYDGNRSSLAARLLFRPNEHVSLDLGAQHNDLQLGGQDFTADLFSAQLRYARDTRTFFLGFVQYNQATEELITNLRFNLIHAPLSDIFVVVTERRSLLGDRSVIVERGLTLKATRLLAF